MKIDNGVNIPWGSKYHMTPDCDLDKLSITMIIFGTDIPHAIFDDNVSYFIMHSEFAIAIFGFDSYLIFEGHINRK